MTLGFEIVDGVLDIRVISYFFGHNGGILYISTLYWPNFLIRTEALRRYELAVDRSNDICRIDKVIPDLFAILHVHGIDYGPALEYRVSPVILLTSFFTFFDIFNDSGLPISFYYSFSCYILINVNPDTHIHHCCTFSPARLVEKSIETFYEDDAVSGQDREGRGPWIFRSMIECWKRNISRPLRPKRKAEQWEESFIWIQIKRKGGSLYRKSFSVVDDLFPSARSPFSNERPEDHQSYLIPLDDNAIHPNLWLRQPHHYSLAGCSLRRAKMKRDSQCWKDLWVDGQGSGSWGRRREDMRE